MSEIAKKGLLISIAQNYLIGSVYPEERLPIVLESEPALEWLQNALINLRK